ncbi:MAG: hypothetical protein Q9227_000336 [Pyrenula ochraceoflavens]
MESWERTRSQSPDRFPRRPSFNPISEWVIPAKTDTKASIDQLGGKNFEVSRATRVVVFGYAAIKPVLIEEGVYRDQCTLEEIRDGELPCYGQEIRLNFMFATAAVATNVAALPVGTILDRFGPRVSGIIGSFLIALGAAFLAFAKSFPFDGYIPGYLFLALGGPVS